MGMQDQYQDGRYDGIQTDEVIEQQEQRDLEERLAPYGLAATGWQAAQEAFMAIPITVQRGGIKYPTPTKEAHTMTENTTPEEATLAELYSLKLQLDERIVELTNKIRNRLIPAAPGISAGNMFKVGVKYAADGPTYHYLIFRAPAAKGWYTTGQGDAGHFATWRELVEWLRRPDVYWHSALVRLVNGNSTIMDAEHPNG